MMEMIDYFAYSGESSKDYGLFIRDFPTYTAAKRRVDSQVIPGRNGDAINDEGAYSNTTRIYTVWLKHRNHHNRLHELSRWLLGSKGYRKLEDTFEPEIYRMAVCSNPLEVATEVIQTGSAEIEFNCKPQRYLKHGSLTQNISKGQRLYNGYMPAQPQIIIQGSGSGVIEIGDQAISIANIPSDGLVLDCELQDAYSQNNHTNCNPYIQLGGEYPKLDHGFTTISWSGGINTVKIIPRWWTL